MVASNVQDLRFSSMFETLSLDVRLCVLEFLQPCDIMAVGQTCRTLYQMMKYRAVWMNALRGVMERHSINPATFPVRTMALPLLKHLAFSPHRFISLVKKTNGASIRPMSIRVISPRLSNAEKKKYRITDKDGINDIYLEPGGRYLASLSCYQNSTLITIWDLGFSGGDAIKPIVRQLVSMSDLTLDGFYSDRQRLGKFYLILSQNSPPSASLAIFVYEVSLMCPFEISNVGKLVIPDNGRSAVPDVAPVSTSSKLTIHYEDSGEHCFCVWDVLNGTAEALTVAACGEKETSVWYDDCIMILSKGSIKVYNMPTLTPLSKVETECEEPTISIAMPSNSFVIEHDTGLDKPYHMLAVSPGRLTFLNVKDSNVQHDPTLPNKLPVPAGSVDITDARFCNQDGFTVLEKCGDHLVLGYDKDDLLELTLFVFDEGEISSKNGDIKLVETVLVNPLGLDILARQFCSLLGRMCILTPGKNVYILDYLGSPE